MNETADLSKEGEFIAELHEKTKWFKKDPPNKSDIPPIFKKYNTKKIILPKNFKKSSVTVEDAIKERASWRDFSGSIGIDEVSKVLYYANGFKELADTDLGILQKTNAPSAGSRHPIELYVILQRIDGVNDGIYHYDNESHLLEELSGSLPEELAGIYNHQSNLTKANMLIFMTAIHRRTSWKYGPRAYRFMHLDAGHIGQNVYLISEAMGLGCCAVGGWNEESARSMLKIDGQRELLVYSVVVGKKASPSMHKNFI